MFGRNFFINKNNGVCHVRSGWLVVKEKTNITNLCEWDKHTTYPQFLYSQHGKVTRWIAKGTILKKASVVQHLYNVFSVTSKVYKYDPFFYFSCFFQNTEKQMFSMYTSKIESCFFFYNQ